MFYGFRRKFKKEQLDAVRGILEPTTKEDYVEYSFRDQLSDFLYYNDFYILSLLIMFILIFHIVNL